MLFTRVTWRHLGAPAPSPFEHIPRRNRWVSALLCRIMAIHPDPRITSPSKYRATILDRCFAAGIWRQQIRQIRGNRAMLSRINSPCVCRSYRLLQPIGVFHHALSSTAAYGGIAGIDGAAVRSPRPREEQPAGSGRRRTTIGSMFVSIDQQALSTPGSSWVAVLTDAERSIIIPIRRPLVAIWEKPVSPYSHRDFSITVTVYKRSHTVSKNCGETRYFGDHAGSIR